MARILANQDNAPTPDADYPYSKIKDNTGVNDGTPVNESVYGDIHQFFAKMVAEAGITLNDLPDNATNGFQLYNSLISILGGVKTIILPIGAWDMDANDRAVVSLPVGVTISQIREVSAVIRSDQSESYQNLNSSQLTIGGSFYEDFTPQGGVINVLSTDAESNNSILLGRKTGGSFDSVGFDDVAINRGFVIIRYVNS